MNPALTWEQPIYQVDLRFDEPIDTASNGDHQTSQELLIDATDKEMAARLLRAFLHAAKLCGARAATEAF